MTSPSGEAEGAAGPRSLEGQAAASAIKQEGWATVEAWLGRARPLRLPPEGWSAWASARAPEPSGLSRTAPGRLPWTAGEGLPSQERDFNNELLHDNRPLINSLLFFGGQIILIKVGWGWGGVMSKDRLVCSIRHGL